MIKEGKEEDAKKLKDAWEESKQKADTFFKEFKIQIKVTEELDKEFLKLQDDKSKERLDKSKKKDKTIIQKYKRQNNISQKLYKELSDCYDLSRLKNLFKD